jgi:hypothetical protein
MKTEQKMKQKMKAKYGTGYLQVNFERVPKTIISRAYAYSRRLKYYFTGKRCKKARHLSQKYTSTGFCVQCSKDYSKEWSQIGVVYDKRVVAVNV